MHYPSSRVPVIFCLSAVVMAFIFYVAGATAVLWCSCIAPQLLLSSSSPFQRHSLEAPHKICPCHGLSATLLTCVYVLIFFSGRNSTRKRPGWSQRSNQLRAEQLRPRGSRRLGSLPEPGCSNRGLGRYLSCGFILHKVVFHLSGLCNCSWVLKSLWNAVMFSCHG